MTTSEEIQAILDKVQEDDRRILYFAALLRREAGLGIDDVVVVGGSAIEIYTEGAYVSGDIDICAPREAIASVLAAWGFKQPGREWARLDWKVVLDVVGPYVSGSMKLSRIVDTPHGPVRVGSIEDLIIRRLALVKFWNESVEYRNAQLLVILPGLDWRYLEFQARKEDLVAELAQLRTLTGKSGPT